jgi:hypothetical protein
VRTDSGGSSLAAAQVSRNPDISVGWEIPDYGGGPQTNDAPKFTVAGTLGNVSGADATCACVGRALRVR